MNEDTNCTGEITRKNSKYKSAMEFILVNQIMHQRFTKIIIDENRSTICLTIMLSAYPNQQLSISTTNNVISIIIHRLRWDSIIFFYSIKIKLHKSVITAEPSGH